MTQLYRVQTFLLISGDESFELRVALTMTKIVINIVRVYGAPFNTLVALYIPVLTSFLCNSMMPIEKQRTPDLYDNVPIPYIYVYVSSETPVIMLNLVDFVTSATPVSTRVFGNSIKIYREFDLREKFAMEFHLKRNMQV
jgi:hypothetical protein